MIEVRGATPADVPAMVALHGTVAAEGKWIGTEAPIDTERFTRLFLESIESPMAHLLVAVDAGIIVGNLGLHPGAPGVISFGMAIASTHRGQGVGTALLSAAIAWARAQPNVHKLELEVWPHNAAAQALYLRHGFVVEGLRRRQYRRRNGELWDSVVMGLVLDETSPGSPHSVD